ncbi:TMV resistance protein [Nymphaea thermarum]|nr:TMV resistance protein [Nymphaea thermarum]
MVAAFLLAVLLIFWGLLMAVLLISLVLNVIFIVLLLRKEIMQRRDSTWRITGFEEKDGRYKGTEQSPSQTPASSTSILTRGLFQSGSSEEEASNIEDMEQWPCPAPASFERGALQRRSPWSSNEGEASSGRSGRVYQFDVFLSFIAEDTGNTFAGHLCAALEVRGIRTFMDERLQKGDQIEDMLGYIVKSKIFVPIFSRRYAGSWWCQKEVAKAVETKRLIIPVYFDVESADVRNQRGQYEDAFQRHENDKRLSEETVSEWRDSLQRASDFLGYSLARETKGYISLSYSLFFRRLVVDFRVRHSLGVERLSVVRPRGMRPSSLNQNDLDVGKYQLIEINGRIKELMELLDMEEQNGVRMVGIHGSGGIGKTTLAKAIFNRISPNFEFSSFISNIREVCAQPNGLISLQNQFIRQLSRSREPEILDSSAGRERLKELMDGKPEAGAASFSGRSRGIFQFDVFLSFRGKDTRKTFTGHLYAALTRRRIQTFIDYKSLEKGESIHELLEYIEKSKIFMPIISRGYAESKWCLMELTQRVRTGRLIIPVFFDVEPSTVKNQSGPFEDAFREHTNNKNVSEETVNEWRDSLRQLAALVGYVLAIQAEGKLLRPSKPKKMTEAGGIQSTNQRSRVNVKAIAKEPNPSLNITMIFCTNHVKIMPPSREDPNYVECEANDRIIMSWILNSMEQKIVEGFLFLYSAKELWDSLAEIYSESISTPTGSNQDGQGRSAISPIPE